MDYFELLAAMETGQKVYFKKQQPTYADIIVGTVAAVIARRIQDQTVHQVEIKPEKGHAVYIAASRDVKPVFKNLKKSLPPAWRCQATSLVRGRLGRYGRYKNEY